VGSEPRCGLILPPRIPIFEMPGNRLWRYTGAWNRCSGPGCDAGASTISGLRGRTGSTGMVKGHWVLGMIPPLSGQSYVPTTTLHMRLSRPNP